MQEDFKSFGKIGNIGTLFMSITQKLHGSNAQIYIYPDDKGILQLKTGSRTRWIYPGDDNYGFAKFVYDNKQDFIDKLGEGRHFGEWAGPGINSGEGLKEKTLFLFNWRRWNKILLPERVKTVPVLYTGKISIQEIEKVMENLKLNGSAIVPGYMKPEGIVIEIAGNYYKKAFQIEEVSWKSGGIKISSKNDYIDVNYLLQPLRLKKLFSRDSRYIENYPQSIRQIVIDYIKDLEEENQITGCEGEIKGIKKALGHHIFPFIKSIINSNEDIP